MKINTFSMSSHDAGDFFPDVSAAHFVAVHGNCTIAPASLGVTGSGAMLHGATSCLGAMTESGVTDGVAVFTIEDPDGAYGTGIAAYGDDPQSAARAATIDALRAADRLGEKPDLVWISGTPGAEEALLQGIESVIGGDVPIIGGSAADNSVSGGWFVFDKRRQLSAGLVVSVMFPSRPVSVAYQSGYAPTSTTGVVTKVDGRRVLEIDGQPAYDVYRAWTQDRVLIDPQDDQMQSILSASTLSPLGREVTELGGVPYYLLAHPAAAGTSGALDLFATVEEGETVTLMTGTQESLIDRAGRVAELARSASRFESVAITGALMVYCGGCMLSVRDRLDDVVQGIDRALDGAPFLGTFTFGEQGAIIGAGNRHGNLMISCIIFG